MKRLLWLIFGVTLCAGAAGAWWLHGQWRQFQTPFRAHPGEVEVTIEPGSTAQAIFDQLESAGVLADARRTALYHRWTKEPPLQAGRYRFGDALTPMQVLERLQSGQVVLRSVTLIEGWTLEETAAHLANRDFGHEAELLALMRDPASIRDLDPAAPDLEGYLFPDSYRFPHGTSEGEIVDTLVATFRKRYRDEVGSRLAPGSSRSVREIVTLASIVEKEARLDSERPTIAGVYSNRLRRGIALYADPTIIFALKRLGRWDGNLRRPDLALDHPYNTYVYPGLPPGPICSPGGASLAAAAAPSDVPYLYFVSRNDGSHVFAATLREHNRNVERWQRQYWRQRWAEERAEKSQ